MNPEESMRLWIKKVSVLFLFGCILFLLYRLESIVFIFLISGFLTLMLHGVVEAGEKRKISPWLTLILVYLFTFFAIILIVSTILPIFVTYISSGITSLTNWLNAIQLAIDKKDLASLGLNQYIESGLNFIIGRVQIEEIFAFIRSNAGSIQSFITNQVSSITSGSISIIGNVGTAVTQSVFIAVMTFLMVLERKRLGQLLLDLAPEKSSRYIKSKFLEVQNILHAWIRGQLMLGISIFVIVLIGLGIIEWVFGISSGKIWTLAMIAGLMEFIPYIGPIIAVVPALVVGLGFSGEVGLTILIFYIVMQQFENNFLVPYIMSKSLNLSPLYVFTMMLIGGILGGILGIVLAVPLAAILNVGVSEYIRRKKNIDNEENLHTIEKVTPPTKPPR